MVIILRLIAVLSLGVGLYVGITAWDNTPIMSFSYFISSSVFAAMFLGFARIIKRQNDEEDRIAQKKEN